MWCSARRSFAPATAAPLPSVSKSAKSRRRAPHSPACAGSSSRSSLELIGTLPMPSVDSEIDRLYQVPLAEFTAERNALAKRAGGQSAEIRALQKPTVPAWAVNQLYWKERRVYDELMERA